MGKQSDIRVTLVCAAGGHLEQMLRILPALTAYQVTLITEESSTISRSDISCEVRFIPKMNRPLSIRSPIFMLKNALTSLVYLRREHPDVVISTGSGSVIPFIFFAKLFGATIVFIESFTKVHSLTLTGHLLYRIADTFVVQWPELLERYPRSVYWGSVY